MLKGIVCVLVQNIYVDVNPIKRVEFSLQLVVARKQLLAKAGKNIRQFRLKVGDVDQFLFLFRELIKL